MEVYFELLFHVLKRICLSLILNFINKYQKLQLEQILPLCLYIYGPDWNWKFEYKRYKTLVLGEICGWHLFIWTETKKSLEKFLVNSSLILSLLTKNPMRKLTFWMLPSRIYVIKINKGRIITNLYYKPANDHQYLHND